MGFKKLDKRQKKIPGDHLGPICLLNSTANSAQYRCKLAGLAVILNSPQDFFPLSLIFLFFYFNFNYEPIETSVAQATTFLSHNNSSVANGDMLVA